MKSLFTYCVLCVIFTAFLSACRKEYVGHEVRIKNYYIEPMDSVLIGDNIVFTNLPRSQYSDYKKVGKGTYNVTFITTSKKHILSGTLQIPKWGTEKITLQIDGQGTVLLMKEK